MTSLSILVRRIDAAWSNAGVSERLRPTSSDWARADVVCGSVPVGLRALLDSCGGMPLGSTDAYEIRFWPANELELATRFLQDFEASTDCVLFADFLVQSHFYGIGVEKGDVCILGGPVTTTVSETFEEFLELYLRGSRSLWG